MAQQYELNTGTIEEGEGDQGQHEGGPGEEDGIPEVATTEGTTMEGAGGAAPDKPTDSWTLQRLRNQMRNLQRSIQIMTRMDRSVQSAETDSTRHRKNMSHLHRCDERTRNKGSTMSGTGKLSANALAKRIDTSGTRSAAHGTGDGRSKGDLVNVKNTEPPVLDLKTHSFVEWWSLVEDHT